MVEIVSICVYGLGSALLEANTVEDKTAGRDRVSPLLIPEGYLLGGSSARPLAPTLCLESRNRPALPCLHANGLAG